MKTVGTADRLKKARLLKGDEQWTMSDFATVIMADYGFDAVAAKVIAKKVKASDKLLGPLASLEYCVVSGKCTMEKLRELLLKEAVSWSGRISFIVDEIMRTGE